MLKEIMVPCVLMIALRADGGDPMSEPIDARFAGPLQPIEEPVVVPEAIPVIGTTPVRNETPVASSTREPNRACEVPGSDGTLTLRYGAQATPPRRENPFDCRVRKTTESRRKLRLSSTILGSRPVAVINQAAVNVGQRIEGFNVVEIATSSVILERNGVFVRLPLGMDVQVREEAG